MASGGADAIAAVWDLDTLACIRTCTQMDGEIKTLSISHDSQYLAYAGEQDMVVIEALQEGLLLVNLYHLLLEGWYRSA